MTLERIAIEQDRIDVMKPAPMPNIYLVVAWFLACNGEPGYWKVHRDSRSQEFLTPEAARKYAESLGSKWGERRIIHIPGDNDVNYVVVGQN